MTCRRSIFATGLAVALVISACSAGVPSVESAPDALPPTTASATPRQPVAESIQTEPSRETNNAEPDLANTPGPREPESGSDDIVARALSPLVWVGCGTSLDCTDLTVPLDWAHPNGPTIDLAMVRRRATGGPAIGTLFMNPGGPGASGVNWLTRSTPVPNDVAAAFDLVSWDPRGIGGSDPLDCSAPLLEFYALDSSPDTAAEQRQLDLAAEQAAASCEAAAGDRLAHIGTDATVFDMEAMRFALGDELFRYVGFSYGSFLGLRYLETFPNNVGAMVLDGVVDPSIDQAEFLREQTLAFEALLQRFVSTCAGQTPCPIETSLAGLLDDLNERSESEPAIVNGSTVGPAEVADAIAGSLYSPSGQRGLLDALGRWAAQDAGGIADLAQRFRDFTGWDAYTAVSCVDGGGLSDPDAVHDLAAELAELSPLLGEAIANELLPCAYWPVAPTRATTLTPLALDPSGIVPLLIGGTNDPATPLHWASSVRDQLQSARLLVFDGEGHTAIGRTVCIDDAVSAYLLEGDLPEPDAVCR